MRTVKESANAVAQARRRLQRFRARPRPDADCRRHRKENQRRARLEAGTGCAPGTARFSLRCQAPTGQATPQVPPVPSRSSTPPPRRRRPVRQRRGAQSPGASQGPGLSGDLPILLRRSAIFDAGNARHPAAIVPPSDQQRGKIQEPPTSPPGQDKNSNDPDPKQHQSGPAHPPTPLQAAAAAFWWSETNPRAFGDRMRPAGRKRKFNGLGRTETPSPGALVGRTCPDSLEGKKPAPPSRTREPATSRAGLFPRSSR